MNYRVDSLSPEMLENRDLFSSSLCSLGYLSKLPPTPQALNSSSCVIKFP